MCGILASSIPIKNLNYVIEYLKLRGPDYTNYSKIGNYDFVHTLLSMTGPKTIQPFFDKDDSIITLFNGEIYNYKTYGNYNSDGECLIPLYKNYGFNFIKKLDGEFAIILLDLKKNILIFSTDIFSTKPIWFSTQNGEWGLSSYESCLKRIGFETALQVEANSTYILKLDTLKIIKRINVYDFNLNQHKNDYKDFFTAFENSIKKRTTNIKHGIFIGLSSGYDSGAIACELNRQKINYTSYSIIGSENKEVINNRISKIADSRLIDLKLMDFLWSRLYLNCNIEDYKMNIDNGEDELYELWNNRYQDECDKSDKIREALSKENSSKILNKKEINNKDKNLILKKIKSIKELIDYRNNYKITDDNGSIGLGHICNKAKKEGKLIYLSGSGSDEIFSDYGFNGIKHFRHSTIGGKFTKNLDEIFPWKNFFDNTQRAYLMKEEYVSGAYGIEGRYPFLDKDLVQEFFYLSLDLKNKAYKSPLSNYLKKYNFPNDFDRKAGFNCGFGNYKSGYSKSISRNNKIGETNDLSLIANFDQIKSKSNQRRDRYTIEKYLQNK